MLDFSPSYNFISVRCNRCPFVLHVCSGDVNAVHCDDEGKGEDYEGERECVAKSCVDAEGRYVATCWHLIADTAYTADVNFQPRQTDEKIEELKDQKRCLVRTSPSPFARSVPTFVAQQHVALPDFLECVLTEKSDWLLSLPSSDRQACLLCDVLFYNAIFALPAGESERLLALPNGLERYCLLLDDQTATHWGHNHKVRKYASEFEIRLDFDFVGALKAAREYHIRLHESTWLSEGFIEVLSALHKKAKSCRVQLHSLELWDKKTNTLAAGILGFSCGRVYHDFSMFTLIRDHRSAGNILTRLAGGILSTCGYRLWYWGNRVDYFVEYEGSYHATSIPRRDFYERWVALREQQPELEIAQQLQAQARLAM